MTNRTYHKTLVKKYVYLMNKYNSLKKDYNLIKRKPNIFKERLEKSLMSITMITSFLLAVFSYIIVKSNLIFEVGIIIFFVDFAWELHGTKKGWWKYSKSSIFDIGKRVPIEIPLSAFFSACIIAAISIWILSLL